MMTIHPTPAQRRWQRFKANRRGYYSLWLFVFFFTLSLFAEIWSNDKPLLISFEGHYYFPLVKSYPETLFGGNFDAEADYNDNYIQQLLTTGDNWVWYPLNPYSYDTINYDNARPNPAPPSANNLLGTDDHGRDVLAQLIYGFRLSVFFGLVLTIIGLFIGVTLGALQGYFGGWFDLLFQRFMEIWGSMPDLYLLIIFAAIFRPSVLLLILLLALFGWMELADYVRAEFLRGRNLDYVKAAHALGVPNFTIIRRHILPNAITPIVTFLPFRTSGAILALTSLDYLGLGLPSTSPSLGRLLKQGTENITTAWWLSLTTFTVIVSTLVLLIFIGEALREAMDARRS